jgi:Uma2 family endonuclease
LRETVPSYWEQHPTPNDILLLAEVSHATLQFDLTTKALLYAKAGISEYWVLDVEERHVVVHREPTPEGYRNITFHGEEEAISPLARPESPLSVSKLFVATKRNT